MEPLLQENKHRFVLHPIKYNDIWQMYKMALASFWTAEEIDLSQDTKDWKSLKPQEQHFIKYILAFFAASDGIVIENLGQRFLNDIQIPEARSFYSCQLMIENIHSQVYSELIDFYIKDTNEKMHLFNAIETIPSIKLKAEWAQKWINSQDNFAMRLIAFACVEGIFFSGAFCSIYWVKKRGLLPGLTFSNELISRDEGMHTDFACLLYSKYITNKLTDQQVIQIVDEAVHIESHFIKESLPVELIGMNSTLMTQYIQFVADHLLYKLINKKYYHVPNPFEWMEMISLQGKTSFFERRVADYQKANVMDNNRHQQLDFNQIDDVEF